MKVAIYSRVIDYEQRNEIQHLFDELIRQHIQPVVHLPFLEQIKHNLVVPSDVSVFNGSDDLD
ncbi:MAG: NAD(+) kinase, partial [Bacteroidetes bacterium]|nr:NAD(+) kinase [Bacteroidota bacterium]